MPFKSPYPLRFFWALSEAVGFVIFVMIVIINPLMVFMKSLEVCWQAVYKLLVNGVKMACHSRPT